MMVLHGVVTGHVHREGDRKPDKDGVVTRWEMDFYNVFDGQTVRECQLSDEFGTLEVGEVVTASVGLSTFREQVQVRLVQRVDAGAVSAFTPELAQLLLNAGMMAATTAEAKPARVAA